MLDEDTESELASKLSKSGYDTERVVNVPELGSGTDDSRVREYAIESNRIIVTHDKDFAKAPEDSHAGVFYAPNQRLSAHQVFGIIQNVVDAYGIRDRMQPVVYLTEDWLQS